MNRCMEEWKKSGKKATHLMYEANLFKTKRFNIKFFYNFSILLRGTFCGCLLSSSFSFVCHKDLVLFLF